jgi:pimeloyl-ACP methyl ester carboxylesterase
MDEAYQSHRWRHIIPLLPPDAPLFVPDLPGYGASAPIKQNDKMHVGGVVLEAVKYKMHLAKNGDYDNIARVILIGHDRGARVAHHVSVSGSRGVTKGVSILGVCLIDIVSLTQPYLHFLKLLLILTT